MQVASQKFDMQKESYKRTKKRTDSIGQLKLGSNYRPLGGISEPKFYTLYNNKGIKVLEQ